MPTTNLHPNEQPRPTSSHAELRVYDALQSGLPSGWTAWHSLRIHDDDGAEGEGDFVLVDPDRGLLVIEVKGGAMEARDGRWFQNGQPLKHSPRDQAHGYLDKLIRRLKHKGAPVPAHGIATWFPDTPVDEDAPNQATLQDDLRGRLLGSNHLAWCAEALPPVLREAIGPHARPVEASTIRALHALWGETWTPRLSLGQRLRVDEADRLQLDATQAQLLNGLSRNQRLLVTGGPGTGKTLLAVEAARRFAAAGQRVLLLCFTDGLGQWLASHLASHSAPGLTPDEMTCGIEARSISQLAVELCAQQGIEMNPHDPKHWEEANLHASEVVEKMGADWDVVIIDEAQDLHEANWLLVEALAGEGTLWAFHDPAQAFWAERSVPEHLFKGFYDLTESYRSPPELMRVAEAIRTRSEDVEAAMQAAQESERLRLVSCPSVSSVPDKVVNEITKLRGEGLKPEEIAVISLRGQGAEGSVLGSEALAKVGVVRADDEGLVDHVVADTFLRFKGLERPAVIVVDGHLVEGEDVGVRWFIAMTRALGICCVVVGPGTLSPIPAESDSHGSQ
jgi:protein-tyrosine-phosphatase